MTLNEFLMSIELGLIYSIVAIGIYVTFRIIDFPDLTCDGSFVLGTATYATLIQSGSSIYVSLLFAIIAGGMAGFLTSILNLYFKINELLSGILTAFMLYSVNLYIMNDVPNITLIHSNTPKLFAIIAIIYALFSYLLNTDFGLCLISVGQNKKLAKSMGVNIKFITTIALALSNSLIAFSGAIFAEYQGFADIGSGTGTVIVGFASVLIGERLIPNKEISYRLLSCILGSILYRILITISLHSEMMGLQTKDLNLITGLLIILVMKLPRRQEC